MKNLFLLFVILFVDNITPLQGQNIPKCISHEAIKYQESLTPGFMKLVDEHFENAKRNSSKSRSNTIIIPVVVHIVYNTPNQNIEDSVIFKQLVNLNEDFQRLNSDTINMRAVFDDIKGNPNIQFELASVDPAGNPTNGITRTTTSTQSFGSQLFLSSDYSDLEKVKQTANGGIDPWDQTSYMNIWVCNMEIFNQTFIQGYATPPLNLPNWQNNPLNIVLSDGVVIQYQYFGSNNPNPIFTSQGDPEINKGRLLTHEVGHYLGLRHIWGDGDCSQEDGIDDTPNASDSNNFDCLTTNNTCVDTINGLDLPDMAENFMDYTIQICTNSFTQGQVDLMRSVLSNQRATLVSAGINGINENYLIKSLLIFPNPFSSFLTIQVSENCTIELKDLVGKLIIKKNAIAGENHIETETLSAGTYIIQVSTSNHRKESKLILKR